jgi:hypothetical protein
MNNSNNQAFPVAGSEHHDFEPGLTKREYLAAMAMQALLSNSNKDYTDLENLLAKRSITYADALLKKLGE